MKKKDSSPLLDAVARSVAAFKAAYAPLDEGNKKGAIRQRIGALSRNPTKGNEMTNFNALQADAPDERVWEPIKVVDMNDDEFSSFIRLMIEGAAHAKSFLDKSKPRYTTSNPRPLPDQETLKYLFEYDAVTGNLIWKKAKSKSIKVGDVAGSMRVDGYVEIRIGGILYKAHRLIYAWHYGEIPDDMQIDHVDGDRANNRIENLRICTKAENLRNQAAHSDSKSGLKGVKHHPNGQWQSVISVDRVDHYLGLYDSKEEAHRAYVTAARSAQGEFLHSSLLSVEPFPRDHKVWDKIARIPGAILPPDADPRQLSLLPDELRAHKKMPSETITGHLSLQSKPNTNLQTPGTNRSDSLVCSPHLHKEELSNESTQF